MKLILLTPKKFHFAPTPDPVCEVPLVFICLFCCVCQFYHFLPSSKPLLLHLSNKRELRHSSPLTPLVHSRRSEGSGARSVSVFLSKCGFAGLRWVRVTSGEASDQACAKKRENTGLGGSNCGGGRPRGGKSGEFTACQTWVSSWQRAQDTGAWLC